jgi:hypothetical protein
MRNKSLETAKEESLPMDEKTITTVVGGTEVEALPSGRPRPGSIVSPGTRDMHKISWTRRDVDETYPSVTWYNPTEMNSVIVHGVKIAFAPDPETGMCTTPSIVRDIILQSHKADSNVNSFIKASGGKVTVGALEKRDF